MKGIADFFALLGRAVFKTIRGIGRFGIFSAASFQCIILTAATPNI